MDHTNDPERYDAKIEKVAATASGFDVTRTDGWGFGLSAEYGLTPKPGDTVTFFGKGLGFPFRGLLINGEVAFYRTEEEQKLWEQVQRYGADAADWLAKWDRGDGVWTVQMGGLSAGYDQAINIAAAEMLRAFLDLKPVLVTGEPIPQEVRDAISTALGDAPSALGLSGAQYGAAFNLAMAIYHLGPIKAVGEAPDDRRIQASQNWPSLTPYLHDAAGDLLAALRLLVAAADCEEQPTDGELETAKAAIKAATGAAS